MATEICDLRCPPSGAVSGQQQRIAARSIHLKYAFNYKIDSDNEEDDEYDQLPPFKPLKKSQPPVAVPLPGMAL
ncbi:hypothetical protein L1887_21141 [Cichorium endivia]|nr:hypothetical protein L1887_21141 [Cichorium endivia]